MSAPGNGHFSLAKYRAEAAKKGDKKGDFVLDVDTDHAIRISRPTGEQMFDAEEAMRAGDSREVIRKLCGEQADEILDLLSAEDHSVVTAFGKDVQKHFGLGE